MSKTCESWTHVMSSTFKRSFVPVSLLQSPVTALQWKVYVHVVGNTALHVTAFPSGWYE
jgi:hypothetical protein